jgi:polyphenol oxidase
MSDEMIFEKRNGLTVGRFNGFAEFPELKAYFSTRTGGISPKPFDSLNLGLRTADNMANVIANRKKFFTNIDIDEFLVVRQMQVHSDTIRYINKPGVYEQTDASYTDQAGIFLTVTASDCVPVLINIPGQNIIGVVHAGWQGTQKNITGKTIQKVCNHFQLDASDIVAVIGPSICPDCLEVDEDVARLFEEQWIIREGYAKPHIDLWKANYDQLFRCGVSRIYSTRICTKHTPELFFSHRGSGGQSGRMIGVIGLTH